MEGLFTPQKLENEKIKLQISILEGIKLKKHEGGVFTDKTGLKIFVFLNAMIFAFTTFVKNTPLWGKNASKVGKKYSPNNSPHFLDAAGGQISDS